MIGLIQRVKHASVAIDGTCVGEIQQGLLVLLGVEKTDDSQKAQRLAERILKYRVFSDELGKMNLNVQQISGAILVVSQFTLVADTSRGNRPGLSKGAEPSVGKALYEEFVANIQKQGVTCATGQFGADMQVSLVNDGPVTFNLTV